MTNWCPWWDVTPWWVKTLATWGVFHLLYTFARGLKQIKHAAGPHDEHDE